MSPRERREALRIAALLRRIPESDDPFLTRFLKGLPTPVYRALHQQWRWQARKGQFEPEGDWRLWVIMAGRGFGKTRAGAEWVSALARADGTLRIALVAATIDEARAVMVEGESGLIAVAHADEQVRYVASKHIVCFPSGAEAHLYSAERPESLRGPQHHAAWCDELAKWRLGEKTWDNLMLGLRLGPRPRTLVTTTPRPGALLKRLLAEPGVVVSNGRTADNFHLPPAYREHIEAAYAGTRLGRQELDGELIEDIEGSLWPLALIEDARVEHPGSEEDFRRIVVGVDPPASSGTCGIVVAGLDRGGTVFVLEDASLGDASPQRWARAVADAAARWRADRVIAEINNGGAMVAACLRAADVRLPLKLVHAARGKVARAEPVAALFERGVAKLAGRFPQLEDQLTGMVRGGLYEGPGASPDRADAMVWALTELMPGTGAEPRVRGF
ncbi:phage terminase family protein [Sphingomonas changbaiensis NBRC 104936]|uniref:Phage terminase family protein n=1 Tax=Sphingomonas changbaiensis NBRC 104936 TaxID=1219043 RepID=A0A0E9MSW7_9SPHN|nr:terminase family protein [Sphingomonas changbaiensis]GAO40669.1 phage terminase family protein [Sphingomonas changbaiensis NBRC 104936]